MMRNLQLSPTDRTANLRAELVATVNAERYAKRPVRPRTMVAALAAFALAGAVTGGTVTSAALASSDKPVTVDAREIAADFTLHRTALFGTPVVVASRGHTIIELGVAPEGAKSIAVNLDCAGPGNLKVEFNDNDKTSMECSDTTTTGNVIIHEVRGTDRQTLTIDASPSTRYNAWASWATKEEDPEMSAAQTAELSDGQVTREEYDTAFDRFASCMSDGGLPLLAINRTGTVISYSTTGDAAYSGTERQCYWGEFREVDVEWQIANQDSSPATQRMRECLTAAGVTPATTTDEIVQQLKDAGIYGLCT